MPTFAIKKVTSIAGQNITPTEYNRMDFLMVDAYGTQRYRYPTDRMAR